MGELHNTYIDSACNYIMHALNALGALMDRRYTTLNQMVLCISGLIVLLVAFSGIVSAEDPIFGNISTRVVTNTSATILWECLYTPVTSQIEYGLTTSYGNNTTEKDFSYWRMTDIVGLSEDTLYHYRIRTTDLDGNSIISDDYNFTTINSTTMENMVKAARADGALPKTYYVAVSGDNSDDGLSLGAAWATPGHAASNVDAGDTVWLIDGDYDCDDTIFNVNGIPEYPIIMKAYNGTPTIDGRVQIISDDYITLDGLTFYNSNPLFNSHTIDVRYATGINLLNCTASDSGVDNIYLWDVTYSKVINCVAHDSGWNDFGIKPSTYNPSTGHHIIVENCTAYDNPAHNGFDCHTDWTTYENCHSNNTTLVPLRTLGAHVMVNNFTGENGNNGINLAGNFTNSTIMNCTLPNKGIRWSGGICRNVTIYNNYINDYYYGIHLSVDGDVLIIKNEIHTEEDWGYTYRIMGSGDVVIRDENITSPYNVRVETDANITVKYTDNKVFTEYMDDEPKYYPNLVNFMFDGGRCKITTYNITLRPTYGHLHDVTVDVWDEATDTYRITASSTVSDNPTWVNLTTKAASATYNITRAGEPYTKATTGADGVLRYRFTDKWNGSQTFEFSYASDGADPVPLVTNLRNDAPTQQTVTLRWDCSALDVDHYTIYKNGTRLNTTESQYYSTTNLTPDTTYTFGVSATTTAGITGDSASITVRTAAEESFGSNTLYIADDVTASKGSYVTVPVMIYDATGVACSGVNLTYDVSVVNVIGVTQGDFTTYFGFDDESAADGWVTINTYINGTSLTGDVKIADLILKAVGDAGDTSPLDMEIIAMADQNGRPVSGTVSNGLFTVVSDTSPPVVADPSASQLIPDDTNGVPSWGETATLSVTVTDESDITSVTIDLSAIGGSPVQPMTHIGGGTTSGQ